MVVLLLLTLVVFFHSQLVHLLYCHMWWSYCYLHCVVVVYIHIHLYYFRLVALPLHASHIIYYIMCT